MPQPYVPTQDEIQAVGNTAGAYVPTAGEAQAASRAPAAYIPTSEEAQAAAPLTDTPSIRQPYQPVDTPSIRQPKLFTPPAPAAPAPTTDQGFFGNIRANFIPSVVSNFNNVKGVLSPTHLGQVIQGAGQVLGQDLYGPENESNLDESEKNDAHNTPEGKAYDQFVTLPLQAVAGDQSMIGHGLAAAGNGNFKEFIKGVPHGISMETQTNPAGQVLNVIALVSGGRMAVSAGASGLAAMSDDLAASAAEANAAGDAAKATRLYNASDQARAAAEHLNATADTIHRGATGGPIGDYVRGSMYKIAGKIAPGSRIAKALGESYAAGKLGSQLAPRVGQSGANGAEIPAGDVAGGSLPANFHMPEAPGAAAPAGAMSHVPPAPPLPTQPMPVAPPPGAPAPGAPPVTPAPNAPGASQDTQDANNARSVVETGLPIAPTEPAAPLPTPEQAANAAQTLPHAPQDVEATSMPAASDAPPPAASAAPGAFQSDYDAKRLQLLDEAVKPLARTGQLTTEAMANIWSQIDTKLAREFSPTTGMLHKSSLIDTINRATEHNVATGEPAQYVDVQPIAKVDPPELRQLGDYLQGELQGLGHVSVYDKGDGTIGVVSVGASAPNVLLALTAAQQQADDHAQKNGTGGFTFGTAPIGAGKDAAATISAAAAAAQSSKPVDAAAAAPIRAPQPVELTAPSQSDVTKGASVGDVHAAMLAHGVIDPNSQSTIDALRAIMRPDFDMNNPLHRAELMESYRKTDEKRAAATSAAAPASSGGGEKTAKAPSTPASTAAPKESTPAAPKEAPASTPLKEGDIFRHEGRQYQITEANTSGVRADDLTGPVPIGRAWSSPQEFEQSTGQKLAPFTGPTKDEKARSNMAQIGRRDEQYLAATYRYAGEQVPSATQMAADLKIPDYRAASVREALLSDRQGEKETPAPAGNPVSKENAHVDEKPATATAAKDTPHPVRAGVDAENGVGAAAAGEAAGTGARVHGVGAANPGDGEGHEGRAALSGSEAGPGGGDRAESVPRAAAGRTANVEPGGSGELRGTHPAPSYPDYRASPEIARLIGASTATQKFNALIGAIETLRAIEARAGHATPEEQEKLALFPGWGWTGNLLHPNNAKPISPNYHPYVKLSALLTPEEKNAAIQATQNSHYTAPDVITATWDAVKRLGFDGGHVLEPAAGIGLFYALMPEDLFGATTRRAIELDSLTGRILQQLYPSSRVDIAGFQKVRLANDSFDLAISNVPFGNVPIHSKDFKQRGLTMIASRVHNYFFAQAIDKVRPGGILAFITSAGTLNAHDPAANQTRAYLAQHAELVGAIRLPNNAFSKNAGTDVTTDLIILQKKGDGVAPGLPFADVANVGTEEDPIFVNEYFATHPEMVLGTHAMDGKMHGGAVNRPQYTVHGDGRPIAEAMAAAIKNLPVNIYARRTHPIDEISPEQAQDNDDAIKAGHSRARTGSMFVQDGKVLQQDADGRLTEREMDPGEAAIIASYLPLRAAITDNLDAQRMGLGDSELAEKQADLKNAYDAFVTKHGVLHKRGNSKPFADDPDMENVMALERYDPKTGTVTGLADIFTQRVIKPTLTVETAETPKDALIASIRTQGRVDVDYMERVSGIPAASLGETLSAGGFIYHDPSSGAWAMAEEYGSGNVRAKLQSAQAAAAADKERYQRNVDYLQTRQPRDLKASEISAKLGAQWIPKTIFEEFLAHLLDVRPYTCKMLYSPYTAQWQVSAYPSSAHTANTATWGTDRANAATLLELLMNSQMPTVKDSDGDRPPKYFLNPEATEAARDKQSQIKAEWESWIYKDPARATRLADIYNATVNVYRDRDYDGSHLQMPGTNPLWEYRPHQKNAIWRIIQEPNTLLAHDVGTGKTGTMQGATMELRRIGLRNKPMHLVLNSTLHQYAADFRRLYPAAKLLIADETRFEKSRRREFLSQIATGDWDAVVITHSAFGLLPMNPDTVERFYDEQLNEMREFLFSYQKENGEDFTTKEVARQIDRMTKVMSVKVDKLRDSQDNNIFWEDLGVDQIFVDEAQEFKNLMYTSTRPGMGSEGSDKAFDLYMKIRTLHDAGGGAVFATGTPLTNSVAEMHTLLRYLAPGILREQQLEHFDAWCQQYADMETDLEKNAAGDYVNKGRIAKFSNLPELMAIYKTIADAVTQADVTSLVLPKLVNQQGEVIDQPIVVETKVNAAQMAYFEDMVARADAMKLKRGKPQKGDDTMLAISTDGRHVSLDARTRMANAPDYPDSKINSLVAKLLWEHNLPENARDRRTQVVFLDLGAPKTKAGGSFDLYADIKKKLVAAGVKPEEIAFVQTYASNPERKQQLFEAVNEGRVRIIMGSRQMLGIGVNIQQRLVAAHQVDPTWRPDQLQQADGRIIRHGNKFAKLGVRIYMYVTKGSFDEFMWKKTARKARFINDVTKGVVDVREAEDINEAEKFGYDQMTATASGNPEVIELINLTEKIKRMKLAQKAHQGAATDLHLAYEQGVKHKLPFQKGLLDKLQEIDAYNKAEKPEKFTITIEGKTLTDRKEAGDLLAKIGLEMEMDEPAKEVGEYAGYKLTAKYKPPHKVNGEIYGEPAAEIRMSPVKFSLVADQIYVSKTRSAFLTNENGVGNVARMDNLWNVTREITGAEKEIERLEDELPKMQAQSKVPFARGGELKKMEKRALELNAKLSKETAGKSRGWGSDIDVDTEYDPDAPTPAEERAAATEESAPAAQETPATAGQETPASSGAAPTTHADRPPSPSKSGEYPLGSTLNAGMDPGLGKFWRDDLVPAAADARTTLAKFRGGLYNLLSPASVSAESGAAARTLRENAAALAQEQEQLRAALASYAKYFDKKMQPDQRIAFIDDMENGVIPQDPYLAEISAALRDVLDQAAEDVQRLGTGKLQSLIENYFPHIWTDKKAAASVYAATFGKSPFQGSRSFLKKRTIATTAAGIAAGLTPITDNPVELVLLKVHEMQRFIMAWKCINEWKGTGILQFVPATMKAPDGWTQLEDKVFTVMGGPTITVKEAFDASVHDALDDVFQKLGITHDRVANLRGGRWAQTDPKAGEVKTKFAGPENILMHELGHVLDERYGLWDFLSAKGLRVPGVQGARKLIQVELRDLADMRFDGRTPSASYRGYVRTKPEKVANAIEAWIHAPAMMERVAPTVKKRLDRFIREHKELHALRDIEPGVAKETRDQEIEVGGLILRGHYYAHPPAAKVINHYLSPGWRGHVVYDFLRAGGNALNQAQLGISGFHFVFTCIDATTSKISLGYVQAGQGLENVARGVLGADAARARAGAAQIGRSAVSLTKGFIPGYAAVENFLHGNKLLREYMKPGTMSTEIAQIVDGLIAAGGRVKQPEIYSNSAWRNFIKALVKAKDRGLDGNMVGAGAALAGAVPKAALAALEVSMIPLMEMWVPRMKLGIFYDMMQEAIDSLPPGTMLTRDQLRDVAGKIWDEVDNRMGQLVYDNLFWAKTTKEAMQLGTRSVGWTLGTLRLGYGAAADAAAIPGKLLMGGGGGSKLPPNIRDLFGGGGGSGPGGAGKSDEPLLTHRLAYPFALVTLVALISAIYMYLHAGRLPQTSTDLMHPQTGRDRPDGHPERVDFPTYIKDAYAYGNKPLQTIGHKTSPWIDTTIDLINDKDFYGVKTRDADAPAVQQLGNSIEYLFKNFEPFSSRNARQFAANGDPVERRAEAFFGILPAPSDVDQTPAERLMHELVQGRMPSGSRTQEQFDHQKERGQAIRTGRGDMDALKTLLRQELHDGQITHRQATIMRHEAHEDPRVVMFKRLSADEAMRVWSVANPQEQQLLRPFLRHKEKGQTRPMKSRIKAALGP